MASSGGQFDEVIRLSVDAGSGGSVEDLSRAIGGLEGVSEETRRALEGLVSELADTQRLQAAAAQYQRIVDAQQDLATALVDLRTEQQRAKAADDAAQDALARHTTALDQARAAQAAYLASTNRTIAGDQQHATAVQQAVAAQRQATTAAGQTAAALNTANTSLSRATQTQTQLGSQSSRLAGQLNQAGISTNQLATSQQILAQRAQQTATALNGQLRAAQASIPAFDSIRGSLGKIATAAGAAIVALQAVQKGVDFGKESLQGAANIEESLSRIQAVIKASDEGIQTIQKTIYEAAQEVNTSSEAAAKAAVAFAETGRTVAQYQEALVPALQLSKAALIDEAEAAGIVDDALDRYGLSTADAARVTDVLVTASAGSASVLKGMSEAMGKLAPAARAIGLSFDQTATYLGFFAQNGVKAEQAAEGLEKIFLGLADPASSLRQTLLQLGDSAPTFASALTLLTNGSEQSEQALNRLDPAAKRVILTLKNQGPEALNEFAKAVENSRGATERLIGTLNNNLNGAFSAFGNSVARIGEQLAEPVLTPLRDELVKLAGQLDAFAKSPAFERIKTSLGNLFNEGIAAFDEFIQAIDWQGFVDNASTSLSAASQKISEFSGDLRTLATSLGDIANTIGVVFNVLAGAFNIVKTAISGAVFAVVQGQLQMSKAFDAITGHVSDTTANLQILSDAAATAAENGINGLVSAGNSLERNLNGLAGGSGAAATGITAVGDAAGTAATPVFDFGTAVERAGLAASNESFWDITGITQYASSLLSTVQAATDSANAQEALRVKVEDAQKTYDALAKSTTASKEEIGAASAQLSNAKRNLDAYNDSTNGVAAASGRLASGLEVQSRTIDGVVTVTAQATQATREHAQAQAEAEQQLALARAELVRLATSTGATRQEFDAASAAVDAAQRKVDAFRQSSQGSAQGAEALRAALDKIGGSSAKLAEDAKNAGNVLDQVFTAFQQGSLKLGDVQTAFDAYAAAQRKSVENSKQWEKDSVESLLAVKASILNVNNTPLKAPDTSGFQAGVDNIRQGSQDIVDTSKQVESSANTAAAANQKVADSSQQAAGGIKQMGEEADSSRGRIADFSVDASKFGAAAINAFNDATMAAMEGGFQTSAALYRYISDITRSYQMLTEKYDQQKASAESLKDANDRFTESNFRNTNRIVGDYQRIADQVRRSADNLDFLNQQDLGQAQAAASALADKIEALERKTRSALQSFSDYSESVQDQIDQANGNQSSVEDRRFQADLERLRRQAEESGTLQSQEYRDAVQRANQLHQLKLQQLQKEGDERRRQDQEAEARNSSSNSGGGSGSGGSAGINRPSVNDTLDIRLDGTNLSNLDLDDPRAMQAITNTILPRIVSAIQRAQRTSTRSNRRTPISG